MAAAAVAVAVAVAVAAAVEAELRNTTGPSFYVLQRVLVKTPMDGLKIMCKKLP